MSVKQSAQKAANFIAKAIKFFTTFIGKIVFYLIIILLVVLLVYIIVMVIAKDIAKILGWEGAISPNDQHADPFRDLTSSGYTQLLNADELVDYHAFEYAVLMDAARFMEETGTIMFGNEKASGDSGDPYFVFSDDAPFDLEMFTGNREMWAYLNAISLAENYISGGASLNSHINQAQYDADTAFNAAQEAAIQQAKAEYAAQQAANNAAGGGAGGNKDTSGEFNNDFINTAWFSGDHSKENLFYYTVENELTGSVSLIPYLEIPRNADTVTYYIEYRDNSSDDFLKDGIKFNLGNLDFVQSSRFEAPMNHANYGGLQYSYGFILEHLFPATICPELNADNTAAYATGDRNYGSNPNKIDLYKEYSESLFYGETGKITEHKIPLKILLDRFMPNASLLAAWQMLSDKDEAKNLVDEIQKTYSDACLTGEEYSGDKLLVKDVFTISASLDEDSKAMDIIDKVALKDASKEKYLNGDETLQLYYCYEALFDSRIWRTVSENAEEGSEEQNNESQNNNEQESQTPTAPVQKFEGGFSGDVIDDIKLVLTHFSENKSVGIQEDTYNRIINDAIKEIAPKESVPISSEDPNAKNGEYIIYTPIANGKYMVECQATRNNEQFRDHYNLDDGADISNKKKIMKEKDHIYNGNPYDAPEEIKECFVPFMKVAFTHKDGLRITAIIISYNDKYYGYIVKGKEIDDLSKITNVNTFAFFGSRDMQSVKPRHWVMAGDLNGAGEKSQEKWAVMDAFEGVGLSMGGISVTFKYTIAGEERTKTLSGSIADWCNYCRIDDDELIAQAFESYLGTFSGGNGKNALISPGELAIIRTPDDPLSQNYEGLLDLTTNGSLSAEGLANYPYNNPDSIGMSGGETTVVDKYYINLKALGYSEGEPFVLDSSSFSSVIKSEITSRISIEQLCTIAAYKPNIGLSSYRSVDYEDAQQYAAENQVIPSSSYDYSGGSLKIEDYSVVMPVRRFIIPITQEIWDKKMRFYLVGGAKSWSGVKKFKNHLTVKGEYKDRDNWIYIINSNPYCNGLFKYECTQKVNWRARLFAPIFAGKGEEATKTRETDVQLVLKEWQEASENGISAADYYVRDLQDLLNFSKGIKSGDEWVVEPVYDNTTNKPYVNYDSYKYMYIPDEITQFDETIAEKAFWTDRLICTVDDDIEQPKENFLRSRAETFTWQIVDYDLYEECRNEDGTSSVYLLWMFGDQLSRTLYATAANCSDEEEKMVMSAWGGYSAVHRAADLYGRSQTSKIKREIFPNGFEGEALIKAEYNNGSVKLIGTDSTSGAGVMVGTNEEIYIDTPGDGLYRDNQPVTLILDGAEYKFNGTAAAAYGYELYRLTKVYKSAEKAEEYLKTQMEKEEKWTELRAVAPGIVSAVNCNATGGFVVHIQHANGTKSVYSHMKRYPLVQEGQYVGAGTLLGYEGTTGNSNGHHVHFSIDVPGISQAPSPVYYLYPFFSPFYYAEKAEEAGYELESDYMSISRTNFPYGQVAGANIPKEDDDLEARIQQMFNENDKFESGDNYPFALKTDENTVMIKNYVPYRAFLKDSQLLYSENNDPENMLKDYSLPNKDDVRTVNKVSYAGEKLKVDPNYFDEEFQKYVKQNNNKITPGEGSGDSSATDESGDSNGSKDNENGGKPGTSGNETVGVNGTYSPSDFSQNKPKMDKNSYTDADFAKMEAELKARVEKAGFGTRAGVVEAALYLASLDYAVPYRGTPQEKENNIGFYPKFGMNRTWGKSVTTKRNQKGHVGTNGMDCTGFVEWAMVNGGVVANGGKPGGPVTNSYTKDEGSLSGNMKAALNYSHTRAHPISNVADVVEPGDIALSYGERNGTKCWTHVGLVVGVDANNIYIAEENTTTHLSGSEKSEGITVNKLVVTQVPKTYKGDRLGYIVLCDDTIYKAENSDGTGNKGNIPKVW